MGRQRNWLSLLTFVIWVNTRTSSALPVEEHSRSLGSSIATSVPTSTPDSRKEVLAHDPPPSPADLLRPDRFQFYTFNQKGEVITKQMTEKEIQSLIAAGGGHAPMEIFEPINVNPDVEVLKVADVVQNVQNVLKQELRKPANVMVSVPTIPGHASDEWTNILPSILGGEPEPSHIKNHQTSETKNKNSVSIESVGSESSSETIVELEPYVHQVPSNKPSRPLTPSKIPGFHIVMTESALEPMEYYNYTQEIMKPEYVPPPKWQPTTLLENSQNTQKPTTSINLMDKLNAYSGKPMIPVSVIDADVILTSTIRNTFNERPIFQKLSTISPSSSSSSVYSNEREKTTTEKTTSKVGEKLDTFSIVSETHSSSVKVPGRPEIKIPGNEPVQTYVPLKSETKTNDYFWTTLSTLKSTTPKLTQSSDQYKTKLTSALEEPVTTPMNPVLYGNDSSDKTTISTTNELPVSTSTETTTRESFAETATERISNFTTSTAVSSEVTKTEVPISYTEIPSIKEIIQALNQAEDQKIMYHTERTPLDDLFVEHLSTTSESMDLTTEYETEFEDTTSMKLLTTVQQKTDVPEVVPNHLADSLSSMFSQVAQTMPPILSGSESFPQAELKSKNVSVSSDETDEKTLTTMSFESTTYAEGNGEEVTSTEFMLDQGSNINISDFASTASTLQLRQKVTKPQDYVSREEPVQKVASSTSKTDQEIFTTKPTTMTLPDSESSTTSIFEKFTEAPIIHINVTAGSMDVQKNQQNNTNESPLIRIQLSETAAALNQVIKNAPTPTGTPYPIINITLPDESHKVSGSIGSSLIAGFPSNTNAAILQDLEPSFNNTNLKNQSLENIGNNSLVTKATTMSVVTEAITSNATEEFLTEVMTSTATETLLSGSATPSSKIDIPVIYLTNTETFSTETSSYETKTTKKPETPLVQVDVNPEATLMNSSSSLPLTMSSTTIKTEIPKEKTAQQNNLNITETLNDKTPSTTQNQKDNEEVMITTTEMGKIEINGTMERFIVNLNKTEIVNKVVPTEEKNSGKIIDASKQNAFNEKIEKLLESKKGSNTNTSTTATQSTTSTMKPNAYNMKEDSDIIAHNKETIKDDEKKKTTEPSSKNKVSVTNTTISSKDDSYIKLGEPKITEPMTKVQNNSTKSKISTIPDKPSTTPTTYIDIKETTKSVIKIPTTPETTDVKTKDESSLDKKTPTSSKPDTLTTMNNTDEKSEEKWTLVSVQDASQNPSKIKPGPKEPPTSTNSPALSNVKQVTDEMHRNGNKPIPLEAVHNAGLNHSVKGLDKDYVFFSNLCNELAFNFWTSANNGLSNSRSLALSPFGLTSMLAMIFLGARGPTSAQMNDVLKLDDVVTFNPHLVFQNITDAVSLARNQGINNAAFIRLLFADRIKVGKLMHFYKEQAQKFYDGFVTEVNFSTISDQVRRRTNLLVKRQTGGRIKDFVKTHTVPLRSPLAALSANVYQTNCNCSSASSEGRDGELYFAVSPAARQRRLVPIPATVWKSGVLAGYEPSLDATAIALGGPEKLVSTIFVIPGQQGHMASGDTLDRLEQKLIATAYSEMAWDKILKVIVPRPSLELQIPKFSHRSVINATAALKRMGLQDLFSRHANLKGIGYGHDIHLADLLQMNLFSTCGDENSSNGRHHVEIYPGTPIRNSREVNSSIDFDPKFYEESYSDSTSSIHEEFLDFNVEDESKNPRLVKNWSREAEVQEKPRLKLDRPFLYFVRHNPYGLILHMGRFNPRLIP